MRRRKVGLLITESKKDFIRGHKSLADQIGARGPVEELFVDDLAYNDWEADRFRRIGTALFNTAIPQAVENLLKQLLSREDFKTLPEAS